MRPNIVVVPSPLLDESRGLDAVAKPVQREALVAEGAVEALVRSVLPGLARVDERRVEALVQSPREDGLRHELGPIVGAEVRRDPALAHEARQHVDDAPRADACLLYTSPSPRDS